MFRCRSARLTRPALATLEHRYIMWLAKLQGPPGRSLETLLHARDSAPMHHPQTSGACPGSSLGAGPGPWPMHVHIARYFSLTC